MFISWFVSRSRELATSIPDKTSENYGADTASENYGADTTSETSSSVCVTEAVSGSVCVTEAVSVSVSIRYKNSLCYVRVAQDGSGWVW